MLAVHVTDDCEDDRMGKVDRRIPAEGSWMRRVYWFCPICDVQIHGSSKQLYYFYVFDFVFHRVGQSKYHRVFEVMKDRTTLRVYQYDPETGRYSVPKIEVKEDGRIVKYTYDYSSDASRPQPSLVTLNTDQKLRQTIQGQGIKAHNPR
jgi:hypothetical protein